MVRLVALVAVGLLATGAAGCGFGVDRGAYVEANERVFAGLPTFPGARVVSETSNGYRARDMTPVVGYGTLFQLALPPSATLPVVSAYFLGRLQPGWRLVSTVDKAVFNFRRGKAGISVNLENLPVHRFEIFVDHAYYGKLGH